MVNNLTVSVESATINVKYLTIWETFNVNVLVLVGSTRGGSYNARLAEAAVAALPADSVVSRFDITRLPFYDADADAAGELGAEVAEFRAAVAAADAVLIATPAYNGSMSGAVKNAIDVASRPREAAPIAATPVAVLSTSLNPRAAQGVVDQVVLSLTIAGAAPLQHNLAVGINEAFEPAATDAPLDAGVGERLAGLVRDLLDVAADEAGDRASAA